MYGTAVCTIKFNNSSLNISNSKIFRLCTIIDCEIFGILPRIGRDGHEMTSARFPNVSASDREAQPGVSAAEWGATASTSIGLIRAATGKPTTDTTRNKPNGLDRWTGDSLVRYRTFHRCGERHAEDRLLTSRFGSIALRRRHRPRPSAAPTDAAVPATGLSRRRHRR